MDAFALRDAVVGEYRDYVESFVHILDPRLDDFVQQQLTRGELWPEAILQLNPAFDRGRTLGQLRDEGVLAPETARFFGEGLRLHRHQEQAIDLAQGRASFVVTTGTGSGKSLTYLLPIVDRVVRDEPGRFGGVRAIIVYPMNALINSQLEALESYQRQHYPDAPIRFDRYTGQTGRDDRDRIIQNPPHILLTNYVMLEYLMVRPYERALLEMATRDLQFLVLDELHVYRGRQGADVSMLIRRLHQRAGHDLQVIGTSATLGTDGSRAERGAAIANAAARLFGVPVPPENVIGETLRRVATTARPEAREALREAVLADPPAPGNTAAVAAHPLTAWAEEAFGVAVEEGTLVRRTPQTFAEAVTQLAAETGLDASQCSQRLVSLLAAANATLLDGQPLFAFRLHQFLSSGSSVYATIEDPGQRRLTMEGQYFADDGRVLYPLAFCRECGQEHYLVSRIIDDDGVERLLPRSPMVGAADDETPGEHGFFTIEAPHDGEALFSGDPDELPENWFVERKSGRRWKDEYAAHNPASLIVNQEGVAAGAGVAGWFQPRPLLLCLRCRAAYDLREGDFRKLASLSQIGRSTATTISVAATVAGLGAQDAEAEVRKVLSFTDNRQDASLQAGHLNDFVQVAQVRSSIVAALDEHGEMASDVLGERMFEAMGLGGTDFLKEAVESGPGFQQGRTAMIDLLEYRALEDLTRGWRVAQPNLEQVGLLRIEYHGLLELASDDARWASVPGFDSAPAELRARVLRAVLDHLRMALAIDDEALTESRTRRTTRLASQWLKEPWALDEDERLRTSTTALLPGIEPTPDEARRSVMRLGARSSIARYLRSRHTWGTEAGFGGEASDEMVRGIVEALRGHILSVVEAGGEARGVRVLGGALRWVPGDGEAAPPDPVRSRALHLRRRAAQRRPNAYFADLYRRGARALRTLVAHEHTGQVDAERRIQREEAFRAGDLPALFCSPTMELGVDIRNLYAVHMRNIPPTPANYAQRSGRAGRGGQPALIVAFAARDNAHDHYFFRQRIQMVAGAVQPPKMDLRNEELVRAHLQAVWLATIGINVGKSVVEVLDLDDVSFPLGPAISDQLSGPVYEARAREALAAAREVVHRAPPEVRQAWWFTEAWLDDVIAAAPAAFDRAFDRWRGLYRDALALRRDLRNITDNPRTPRDERELAEKREQEVRREIQLLLNESGAYEDSDFYPYRYLSTEGFLPGYSFPRLPVRAFVSTEGRSQAISRPRFLGIAEFAPGNQLYHEGRKFRVTAAQVPAPGLEGRMVAARLCKACGYIHPGEDATRELCGHCGSRLDASQGPIHSRLLEQPAMRTRPSQRISSDEEERLRSGYDITTHYRFGEQRSALEVAVDGTVLLDGVAAAAATVWRINNGYRRGSRRRSGRDATFTGSEGFTLNPGDGRWVDDGGGASPARAGSLAGVRTFVQDTRNILLLRPVLPPGHAQDARFYPSLLYALQRGIQLAHQVEEGEIAAELIGEAANQRLMYWEAAEGGTGIWSELTQPGRGLATIARSALQALHYDPVSGEDDPDQTACPAACYDCLQTYANQRHHRDLDRRVVREFLIQLSRAETVSGSSAETRDQHYARLLQSVDPASSFERRFLSELFAAGLRLPDRAQFSPAADVFVQPDFFYERPGLPGVCVFIDGADHAQPGIAAQDQRLRAQLEDLGFRVIAIRWDKGIEEQLRAHPDVFGIAS